jgi:hypothetical protein
MIRKPVGKNLMVYDSAQDAVHILNPTAQLVEELARQGLGEVAIAGELRKRFHLGEDSTVLAEVGACLEDLAAKHLLDPRP